MGNETARQGQLFAPAYGSHQVVSINGSLVVEKRYTCGTAEESASLLSLISVLKGLDIPTVIHIYDATESPSKDIIVHFEHCPATLAQDICVKKATYYRYTEHELYHFIDCVLSGLMAFAFSNLNHRDLWPGNILVAQNPEDPKQKMFKIGYPLLMNQKTVERSYATMHQLQRQEQVYFGPQMFEAVNKLANTPYSLEKSDVYSLGLVALEMATLEPVWTVYNHQTGQVNQLEVNKLLRICGERYSEHLTALLRDMLIYEDEHRPVFQQVFVVLEPLLERCSQEHPINIKSTEHVMEHVPAESPIKNQPAQVSVTNYPLSHQRKIEVTSNKRLRASLKSHPEPMKSPQASTEEAARSEKYPHNLAKSDVRLLTFCWVTEPSFLKEIFVRKNAGLFQ